MKRILLSFLGLFLLNISMSQTVENFSYTSTGVTANDSLTNTAIGGNLWKRHSGTGTPILWSATGLTYAGYSGSNIGGAVSFTHGSGSREDANIATWDSIKTGSVYASFLLNVTNSGGTTGDYFLHFLAANGVSAGSDFKARVFFKDGATTGTFKLGLSKGSAAANAVFTTTDYLVGQTYLVVVKYTFNSTTSTDDAVNAYIFTSGVPATEPLSPDLTASVVADLATSDIAKVYALGIRQGTVGTGAAIVDGIRISDAWYNSPLPVSLKSFNASLINNKVALNWNTSNEINVDGFSIEKSNDGRTFSNIGFVAARNAASANYTFNDVLAAGVNYYRLKVTDKDGSFKYSSVVAVNAKQSTKLDIFPNPVVNIATLSHTKAGDNATVKLITIDGKTVLTQNIQTGATQSSIDVSKLIKGNYLVVFENDGNRTSLQFVKQ